MPPGRRTRHEPGCKVRSACATRPPSSRRSGPGCRSRRWSGARCASRRRAGNGRGCRPSMPRRRRPSTSTTRSSSSMLLLRQARRHLHLPDGDRGAVLPGGGRAARRRGRRGAAEAHPRGPRRGGAGARASTTSWSSPPPSSRPRSSAGSAPRRGTISPGGRSGARRQQRFRIGYAPPDRFALRDHLAGKGVPVDMMVEAGLLVTGDDVAGPVRPLPRPGHVPDRRPARPGDRLRGAGALRADVPAKYLNSPDTPLFNKGRLLYNFHHRPPAGA